MRRRIMRVSQIEPGRRFRLPLEGEGGPCVSKGWMRAMPEETPVLPAVLVQRRALSSDPTSSSLLIPQAGKGVRVIVKS